MSSPKLFPPYRAEHIGSLKRPLELLKHREDFEKGIITKAELTAAEDAAIQTIVQVQRDAGIKAMTDGEFRRFVCVDVVPDEDLMV